MFHCKYSTEVNVFKVLLTDFCALLDRQFMKNFLIKITHSRTKCWFEVWNFQVNGSLNRIKIKFDKSLYVI
jgi:hypothetical protein